jgi:drug/metabolite transporter (DMT)-like permease
MAYVLAFAASLFFATSGPLIRLASDLPPAEIGALRMLVGAALVGGAAVALGQGASLRLPRGSRGRFVLYGLVTALHFLFYIASFSFTSIAHALLLVNMAPLFTVLLGRWFLKETPSPRTYPGMALALGGVVALTGFSPEFTPRMLVGDLMALLAGLWYAVYTIAGRRERERCGLLPYAFWVYLLAACFLAPFAAVVAGAVGALVRVGGVVAPTGRSLVAVLLLGLLPTAFGHTLLNAALRRGQATYVNLIVTLEIVGGIALGWLLLGEAPPPGTYLGGALGLAGIVWMIVGARRAASAAAEDVPGRR